MNRKGFIINFVYLFLLFLMGKILISHLMSIYPVTVDALTSSSDKFVIRNLDI